MPISMQEILDIQEELATQMGICTTVAISKSGVARIDLGTSEYCHFEFYKKQAQLKTKHTSRQFPYSFENVFHALGLVSNTDEFPVERFKQDFFWKKSCSSSWLLYSHPNKKMIPPYTITFQLGEYVLRTNASMAIPFPTRERAFEAGLRKAVSRGYYHNEQYAHLWGVRSSVPTIQRRRSSTHQ